MIIAMLIVVGLALGSFVNALVWRVHEQETHKKKDKKLSVVSGRSMCPHCRHELAAQDLIPVLSWLMLRGRCRYCHKPISPQYPAVELATAALFAASYIWWPKPWSGAQDVIFCLWLVLLTGLMALIVYDFRWLLLPDRILYPTAVVAALLAVVAASTATRPLVAVLNTAGAVIIGGGVFYVLFQVSDGKWIGGGDAKLGWVLGLVAATPARSVLFIFLAALLGSLVSLPLLAVGRLKRTSVIPFGPFLIMGLIIVQLFGQTWLAWYQRTFLPFTI
ncbi:MAG TPA: prepilin peptidase [Verrucomicrobiae bacterium]|nr:prepilin peptidase [Verrucomicrobiae bacterium]